MSTSWPAGVGRIILTETDSTNAEAARRAAATAGPAWILALSQTAGRGRRGRTWANPPGNFAATYLMHPTETADLVALRSFVAALALFDTIVAVTGRSEGVALKWPNDVLLNGGKLAGILLESVGRGGAVAHLAVGIGVNLTDVPDVGTLDPGALRPVALMHETGARVSAEEFLDLLAPNYAHWERQFTTFGFAPIRQAWLNSAARVGETITARIGTDEQTGTFETIDETGSLILNTSNGMRAIPAAEIYF